MLCLVHISGSCSGPGTILRSELPPSEAGLQRGISGSSCPPDQRLLAVAWKGTTYSDKGLPFGLRSAPKIFSALTDAMMWALHDRGVKAALHYLDDFLVLGPPDQPDCGQALATTLALCSELGFPVPSEKTEGPSTTLTFLGIEIDTAQQQVRLPQDNLHRLSATIATWMNLADHPTPRGSGKKRELLSLIGLLNHAATVVRPGRAFLRSLIDAGAKVHDLYHWIHLNRAARADLAWWHTFLVTWNGTSILPPTGPSFRVVSDASGSWGCGVIHGNRWFQLQWPESWASVTIATKELAPIVVATTLGGPYWAGKGMQFLCDNAAVVAAVNRGAAKDPTLSHLLQILAFLAAILDLRIMAKHLPGIHNISADALSRNKLHFPQPTRIPNTSNHSSRAAGAGVQPRHSLDLSKLDRTVECFMDNSIAPSTRSAYASAQRRYAAFCASYAVQPPTLCKRSHCAGT